MSRDKTGPERDPRIVYADIIDLPHPRSSRHPSMSLQDRAAQFAPFAALSGYDGMILEEARVTDEWIEPGEDALEQLNLQLESVARRLESGEPCLFEITYFVPDPLKSGGSYVTAAEEIRRVDAANRRLVLARTAGRSGSHITLGIDQILELRELPSGV